MSRAGDCDALVLAAVAAFGALDILVNNIVVAVAGNVVDPGEAEWDRVLNLSLKTMFLASKSAVPVMAAKGSGAIVNIGSISGSRGGDYVGYAAAKGGVNPLTVARPPSPAPPGTPANPTPPPPLTTP